MRCIALLLAFAVTVDAGILNRGPVRMLCHRTANHDMPENTLESLELAARMGCSVVEIDLRMTLDRKIVVNHDGLLEHLTNGMGDVETTYFTELHSLDTGAWMGQRFAGLHIPPFVDALHIAEELGIGLVLDLKDKGMAEPLLATLRHENMLAKVRFGGEWSDVHDAYPSANEDRDASIDPPFTREAIQKLHDEGKTVIANFSANGHEMDLPAMRSAVAAGVDWINVDYPRLGADAIGQPIEAKIAALIKKANTADTATRAQTILELAHYQGVHLQPAFTRWLLDTNEEISHAAALALLSTRPVAPPSLFLSALTASSRTARKNAAWALGTLSAPVSESLVPLLTETDPRFLQEILLAISRCPGNVASDRLEPFLTHADPLVRGAAALALARHQPQVAADILPHILAAQEAAIAKDNAAYVAKGKPRLSQLEIDVIVTLYRSLMKMLASGAFFSQQDALQFFATEAFRSASDYSATLAPVAAFQLWDRIDADPSVAIRALSSGDPEVANRAEWTLINASASVLPAVRDALHSPSKSECERALRILAWQQDTASLASLRAMRLSGEIDPALIAWAIEKIGLLSPTVE